MAHTQTLCVAILEIAREWYLGKYRAVGTAGCDFDEHMHSILPTPSYMVPSQRMRRTNRRTLAGNTKPSCLQIPLNAFHSFCSLVTGLEESPSFISSRPLLGNICALV